MLYYLGRNFRFTFLIGKANVRNFLSLPFYLKDTLQIKFWISVYPSTEKSSINPQLKRSCFLLY